MPDNPYPLWVKELNAVRKSIPPVSRKRFDSVTDSLSARIVELEISNRDSGRIINELNQQIAELEKDKARMDWLSALPYACFGGWRKHGTEGVQLETKGYAEFGHILREAIDAAIQSEKANGR